MQVDMHMHSTASDGQYAPAELVRKVKEAGIGMMALTDHDSVGGVTEAKAAAKELGIICIPGIELSIAHEAELHMLGYGIDIRSETLAEFCAELVRDRNERTDRIIDFLAEYHIDINKEEVEEIAGSNVVGRPHFARIMLQKGYVSSIQEAFDKYLATEGFASIERPKPSAERGLSMIQEAGGIAVLAHPRSLKKTGEALEEELCHLVDLGLIGIETYYSGHTGRQTEEYHALAVKYGLLETAGSDFHGEKIKPAIYLGRKEGGQEPLTDESKLNLDYLAQLQHI